MIFIIVDKFLPILVYGNSVLLGLRIVASMAVSNKPKAGFKVLLAEMDCVL